MGTSARHDDITDRHEHELRARPRGLPDDPPGVDGALRTLLGPGTGPCLEIGCGTGERAGLVRELGRTPVGVDVSGGLLAHAAGRLPVARADAAHLPICSSCVPAAVSVIVHTDLPHYVDVLAEVVRVLEPGGVFVHVGAVHWPLPALLEAFVRAGLTLERVAERGEPVPTVLAIRARKPMAA